MQVLNDTSQLAAALLAAAHARPPRDAPAGVGDQPLAPRLGLSRQTLNYHLRELEREGFLEVVEERPRRGCVERLLKVTSRAFVVNPALLGALSDDPHQARDRFSSAFLLATATGLIRDVAVLTRTGPSGGAAPGDVHDGLRDRLRVAGGAFVRSPRSWHRRSRRWPRNTTTPPPRAAAFVSSSARIRS
mgnify:CR=1 FL=1